NALNVPTHKAKIVITFNEYIQLKDAVKNIVLSPPQKKKPITKIKGKTIVVTFPQDLDSATTYSINFGSAIADNNEGNILENFVYSFSTGNSIDSMLMSGTVVDYATLLPMSDITIALYANPTDSCVFNTLPSAVARNDKWGYFCVRNLKKIPYAVYAFKDDNGNNKYDSGSEQIGFLDSLFTPSVVMKKGMPQLASYNMKDTLACLTRPCEADIYIFKERPSNQYIRNSGRPTLRGAFLKFNAPDAIIDSFSIRGVRQDKLIKQFNKTFDSLAFWVNEG
ncbi:MAG: Ig-like domain-containing protein, partial [Bacteroidales bacterium]